MIETERKISGNMFDSQPLKGQHALVTGGSRGIGAAISNDLARLGADISLLARNAGTLNTQAEYLTSEFGVNVAVASADMAKEEDVQSAFAAVTEELGSVSILIKNAGIAPSAPFHKMDMKLWENTIGLNLTGTFLCCKEVFGPMRDAGYGRIVNIASTVGLTSYPYIAAYTASKHGVVGLTRALAMEGARKGITVNAICPGYTDTDLVSGAIDNIVGKTGMDAGDVKSELASHNPMARLVTPEEVAETTAWLCLPSSASITGQSIVVAGGAVMN